MVKHEFTEPMHDAQGFRIHHEDDRRSRLRRQTDLSVIAGHIGELLSAAYLVDGGELGITAREHIRRQADRAVARTDENLTHRAQVRARLSVEAALLEAESIAMRPDEDHSAAHLIRAALQRFRNAFLRVDPAGLAIRSFEHGLTAPEAREADPLLADRLCLKCDRTLYTPADRNSSLCGPCREARMAAVRR